MSEMRFKTISGTRIKFLKPTCLAHRETISMEFDWSSVKKLASEKMSKCLDSTMSQLSSLRTSGANPAMLSRVFVDYYGVSTPLEKVARVSASGPTQLVVEPFDKEAIQNIEHAIMASGLTPNTDATVIRINIPPLSEERRKELVKQAKTISEEGKVSLRNVRRDIVEKIKGAEKAKEIGKDNSKTYQDDLQKVSDDFTKKLDVILKTKEKDLLTV